ncbi:amino acid ABC transporter permease [Roseibium sediminicola]|uniref:Amino acid ABC transporter permease n=1 Tax=Roseibium sediminicola TaxID=2933272 RepID=A0ABT0H2Q4_9HYPH|nr:amino acid ABC transporter permease [Roseibium sp. CAU 1639]MCK7615949.1 amino acid ABC transporter permease [Roseibium sp. CAU 1639]
MLYVDTVVAERLVHRPRFIVAMVVVVSLALLTFNLNDTVFAEILRPIIGAPDQAGWFGRLSIAFILSILFMLNIVVIGFLQFKLQLLIVWSELLLLFLFFFYGFELDFDFIRTKFWFLVTQGVFTTLYVSMVSIVLASIVALFGAVAKLSSNGFAYAIASFYTSLFRGVPLLMQVYLIYLGLPQLGYVIDAVPAGILALVLCYGAYMTEIFRGGIQSVSKGQWEASRALGFKFGLTMRRIILPQAIPLIIPSTGNQFIAMLKDSSLVSVIGVWELMFLARTAGSKDFRHMEMLITAALIYWALSIILELIQSRIERHYRTQSH